VSFALLLGLIPSRTKSFFALFLKAHGFCFGRIFFVSKFMSKNKKIILIVLIALVCGGIFFFNLRATSKTADVTYAYTNTFPGPLTVYDFMEEFRREGKINFTEKNYIGMGKFIEEINGVKGDSDHNWIYYVNGRQAQVGVSNYKLKPGDVVSWKYEENY